MQIRCVGCGKIAELPDEMAQQLFNTLEDFEDLDGLYFTCSVCRDNPKVQENIAADMRRKLAAYLN